ncbi:hypothetical protein PIB30_001709 [Stylosanthes scabra]|uniref:Secreted protein n=1 Tax=Stylosanthes scabra TaxID=79078 RepID=A0ABU6U1N7_9FABA|nr:hypothetical protein [Stylosanthes scabra]
MIIKRNPSLLLPLSTAIVTHMAAVSSFSSSVARVACSPSSSSSSSSEANTFSMSNDAFTILESAAVASCFSFSSHLHNRGVTPPWHWRRSCGFGGHQLEATVTYRRF